MIPQADCVICGAGIAGVATSYFLSRAGVKEIVLVDERPPLSFTSDRSTECYRNWWPDGEMVALMNRSIDLMEALAEQSGNVFRLNRRGYLYVTADAAKARGLENAARAVSGLGAGPVRIHTSPSADYQPAPPEGYREQPSGADLILNPELLLTCYPYLTSRALAALHIRRAGWLSAQQLGMHLLDQARGRGVRFERGRVSGVNAAGGRVRAVTLESGAQIHTPVFINAAGPHLRDVGTLMGAALPVHTELHLKAAIKDSLGIVGRDAPLLIWQDEQALPWERDERQALLEDSSTRWLTGKFPPGVHIRPEGGSDSRTVLMLWEYQEQQMEPGWPPPLDELYPEIALRGLAAMLPGIRKYFGRMPRPQLDGGYYTKTRENRPLIGPMDLDGAFVLGALSGFGIMAACSAGELLAAHVTRSTLPWYAAGFHPGRYGDPEYQKRLESWGDSGQL